METLKNITVLLIVVWTNILISQESKQVFELKETHNTFYFFNSIVLDGKLFFGTDSANNVATTDQDVTALIVQNKTSDAVVPFN